MSRSVSALEKLGKAGKVFGFGAWLFDSCTPAVAPGSVNAVRASPDTFSTLHTGNPAGEIMMMSMMMNVMKVGLIRRRWVVERWNEHQGH